MPDPVLDRIRSWLRDHEQELLDDTVRMLRIPSLDSEALPNAPFGRTNREALDLALSLTKKWGMKTVDIDGYVGYGEFGQGDRLVMSLGHLDVVPVGDGWKHEPFGAEIDGGFIYARGSTDDKGPTMASLYAMRAIMECAPNVPARLRQVFGCNEESGFKCVHRYMETEEAPTYGIAPDSAWPLIHAEKGICDLVVSVPLPKGELTLLEASGGQRPNIVVDAAEAKLRVAASARSHVEERIADAWDANVKTSWAGDVLHIKAKGKAAHGSTPFMGDSAATRLFRYILDLAPLDVHDAYEEIFLTTHPSGAGIGIHGEDDVSRDLTSNLGIVSVEAGRLVLLFNVRYPVTWTGAQLQAKCEAYLAELKGDFKLDVARDSPPLYFPLDHPLVKAICDVVREETGLERKPGVMGGGTYARAVPNTVSVGTCWEGDGNAHETDERYKVEHLFRASRVYAHILYRLAIMP